MSDNSEWSEDDFKFQVTWAQDADGEPTLNVAFGTQLPDNVSDDMKLQGLARLMSSLAVRLASSRVSDEDDEYGWDDDED